MHNTAHAYIDGICYGMDLISGTIHKRLRQYYDFHNYVNSKYLNQYRIFFWHLFIQQWFIRFSFMQFVIYYVQFLNVYALTILPVVCIADTTLNLYTYTCTQAL